ncbi:response regulator transcription factor [Variovorax sp. J22R115]|uniref:response regulator transcription factor n=1 Tax=Variovorax sp. J22R115 TaxID=3053509 RepID=UPI002574C727|nr:response regulator [Variovorax sp. J22R115]MDM0048858.1 response regulator [Variovorax sp. J22R115]
MSEARPTVYIVDDDPSFLTATSRLLLASGFAVKTFSSAGDFLTQCEDATPGCVVADLQMPGVDGLELQRALSRTCNPMPLVFLTGHGDIASSVRAMRGGAEDFLEKRAPKEELLDAVRRALLRGEHERDARAHQDRLRKRFAALSVREREVLSHVLRGRLNKQIAGDLGINERTVKLHRAAIMSKCGVHSTVELSRLALEAGIEMSDATNADDSQA